MTNYNIITRDGIIAWHNSSSLLWSHHVKYFFCYNNNTLYLSRHIFLSLSNVSFIINEWTDEPDRFLMRSLWEMWIIPHYKNWKFRCQCWFLWLMSFSCFCVLFFNIIMDLYSICLSLSPLYKLSCGLSNSKAEQKRCLGSGQSHVIIRLYVSLYHVLICRFFLLRWLDVIFKKIKLFLFLAFEIRQCR